MRNPALQDLPRTGHGRCIAVVTGATLTTAAAIVADNPASPEGAGYALSFFVLLTVLMISSTLLVFGALGRHSRSWWRNAGPTALGFVLPVVFLVVLLR